MVSDVPYYSQWESPELVNSLLEGTTSAAADPRWRSSGWSTEDEYAFWSWHACGVACLRMAIANQGHAPPSVMQLVRLLEQAGGYKVESTRVLGLFYAPMVDVIRKNPTWGIGAVVAAPLTTGALVDHILSGGLVMASVNPAIRDAHLPSEQPPSVRGGHLVLVVDAIDDVIYINNPSGRPHVSQERYPVPMAVFSRYFADRGILITEGATR